MAIIQVSGWDEHFQLKRWQGSSKPGCSVIWINLIIQRLWNMHLISILMKFVFLACHQILHLRVAAGNQPYGIFNLCRSRWDMCSVAESALVMFKFTQAFKKLLVICRQRNDMVWICRQTFFCRGDKCSEVGNCTAAIICLFIYKVYYIYVSTLFCFHCCLGKMEWIRWGISDT